MQRDQLRLTFVRNNGPIKFEIDKIEFVNTDCSFVSFFVVITASAQLERTDCVFALEYANLDVTCLPCLVRARCC